ncbi:MAG: carbohydrate porin [Planctomycetales bacterium]|nr:carbohydrate porin [Planctomycetales bacterium]
MKFIDRRNRCNFSSGLATFFLTLTVGASAFAQFCDTLENRDCAAAPGCDTSEPDAFCDLSAASLACNANCDCCLCRQTLLGDIGGARTCLGSHGIAFDADLTQFYYGTVDGGLQREFRYAAHGDYVMNIDAHKLGSWEGLFIKLRAEHRFGESLADATGALLPANLLADLPAADSEALMLTNVLFTQMLSETFGVFAGKLDTLDGDLNAFAHGRGKAQFSNAAFVVTPIGLRTVVYSTLGAGFVILRDGEPFLTMSVLNASDTADTSGLEDLFEDGVVLVPELRLPTCFFGMPGHQLFGATWSSRDYASLQQNPVVILPNVPIQRQSDSWSLYWNFDQYFYVDPCNPQRGWGVFGRAGVADEGTNPIASFLSFGVGGASLVPCRETDTFGAGWYYSETSTDLLPALQSRLGQLGDGQGIELFYSAQITPWFNLTADLQVIEPARQAVDTALLAGLRANMSF